MPRSSSHSSTSRGSKSFFLLLSLPFVTVAQQCTVCKDGEPVPLPNYPLQIEAIPVSTCGELDITVSFLTASSSLCNLVNAVGPICGCAVGPDACALCGSIDNAQLTLPTKELGGLSGEDLLPNYPAASQVSSVTCELLDAAIKTEEKQGAQACSDWQQKYAVECGCLAPTTSPTGANDAPVAPTTPAPTTAPRAASNDFQCTFCADGSVPPNGDEPVRLGNIPAEKCSQVDSKIDFLLVDSLPCQQLRTLGPICGCASTLDVKEMTATTSADDANATAAPVARCSLCHDASSVPYPDAFVQGVALDSVLPGGHAKGLDWYCQLLEAALLSHPADSQVCTDAQIHLSQQCGCPAHPQSNLIDVPIVPMPPRSRTQATTSAATATTTTTTTTISTSSFTIMMMTMVMGVFMVE